MDEQRFDVWTRDFATLTAHASRRLGLRLLAAGGLAIALERFQRQETEAKKKHTKRKKHQKKHRPSSPGICPRGSFKQCVGPAADAFVTTIQPCRPVCEEPESDACQQCLMPALEAAANATSACVVKPCGKPIGVDNAQRGKPRAVTRHLVAAIADQCDSSEADVCLKRLERDFGKCMALAAVVCFETAGIGCVAGIIYCMDQWSAGWRDCEEDAGCQSGYCKGNLCCPEYLDTACNGECCDFWRCQKCVGGACKGCPANTRCTITYDDRNQEKQECRCSPGFSGCADLCCESRAPVCEECVDGTCQPKCKPPQVCAGEFFPSCECPGNGKVCGQSCCSASETCCYDRCIPVGEKCCRLGDQPCPAGIQECCESLGQCQTKTGRCCEVGLVGCESNCAIGHC